MKNSFRILAFMAVGLVLLSASGCDRLRARDQLNKGVASYKNAKYEEAIDHFQQAVSLDPRLIVARLYLATAYAQQYIPGVDTPDNVRLGELSIEQFKSVLGMNPNKEMQITSNKGIASLELQMKRFDEAKAAYRRAQELDPNDPETYYSVGVIDWTQTYQPRMEARAQLGLKPEEPLNPKKKDEAKICADLKQKNSANIQEGLDALNKAMGLRQNYDDAMAYMNLLYRERADVECDDLAARSADLKAADEWVDKTMAAKKANAEKQPGVQGITLDQPK